MSKKAWILLFCGILLGLVGFRLARDQYRAWQTSRLAGPHLKRCQQECQDAVDRRIQELRQYFADRRQRCRPFAEEALSFTSKVKLLFYGDSHIREAFEKHLFSAESLQKEIERTITLCLQDINNAENKMLVALQADLATHAPSLAGLSNEELRRRYDELIARIATDPSMSLKEDVIREVSLTVASEILVAVLRQLAVRAGILGTGAASGWASFGVGLIIAIVLDQIWDWYFDPVGQLATKLDNQLRDLEMWIIQGSNEQPGLYARLTKVASDRAKWREEAVITMLRQSQGGN
jgi:hypothetical protein